MTRIDGSSGHILADRRHAYALAARADGDHEAAADLMRQALELAPGWAAGWFALGEDEAALGRTASAIEAFTRALALDAEDRLGAGLHLARLGSSPASGAMTGAYVEALFDQYAPRFDSELVGNLAYRGPELIIDAITRVMNASGRDVRFRDVLELGCGTGLFGLALAASCGRLSGVDLSQGMVSRARQTRVYNRLHVGDMVRWLGDEPEGEADLVVAVDVFVYVADLAPVLALARRALGPDGLIAFSVQTHEGDEDIRLGPDLRYAHSRGYVETALIEAGFSPRLVEEASTRRERGEPVAGLIAVAGPG